MTREQAIRTIEALYPADSAFPATRMQGQQLLANAKRECEAEDWRDQSDAVLTRYAELCLEQQRMLEAYAQRHTGH